MSRCTGHSIMRYVKSLNTRSLTRVICTILEKWRRPQPAMLFLVITFTLRTRIGEKKIYIIYIRLYKTYYIYTHIYITYYLYKNIYNIYIFYIYTHIYLTQESTVETRNDLELFKSTSEYTEIISVAILHQYPVYTSALLVLFFSRLGNPIYVWDKISFYLKRV